MSPEINVADSFQSPTDVSGTISESNSDDGSELQEGDTYLPMEQDDITPNLYNPEFMDEDGDYNTLLGGISFDFQDLNEDLTPPLNLYNGC